MRRRYMNASKGEPFDYVNYLTIEALEDDVIVVVPNYTEIGVDGIGWEKAKLKRLKQGQMLSIRREYRDDIYLSLRIDGKYNLHGNCMSILYGDKAVNTTSINTKILGGLFANSNGLISVAPNFLPATTLVNGCYENMFHGCTSLVTAPTLPATTLADNCYSRMFEGCTSLTTAPELPATTLANGCYQGMFIGCTKLNYIKMLATDISAINCLSHWVQRVSSTGTFVKNKNATWDVKGVNGVPSGWTIQKV